MGKKKTRTYLVNGAKKSFYFAALKSAFTKTAIKKGVRIGELEQSLGDFVGVTKDAVHQWRNERSAPDSFDAIKQVAQYLELDFEDLLCDDKEEQVKKLNDRQHDAVSRVYSEIMDYILIFEQSDGFVWKNYEISDGSPFSKYLISFDQMASGGVRAEFKDGIDLAISAWTWLSYSLKREWVVLSDHPIYTELEAYIDEPLLEMWNGKTDPGYRFEPVDPDFDMSEWSIWTEAERARKGAKTIIERYL